MFQFKLKQTTTTSTFNQTYHAFNGCVCLQMNKLNLECKEIDDEAAISLAQCSHNIEHLSLKDCSLTAIGWKTVFSGLANTNEKVTFGHAKICLIHFLMEWI